MARLLLYHRDYVPSDALKSARGYRPGDVVVVMPDGHVWGASEQPPAFLHLDVPGPVSDYDALLEEHPQSPVVLNAPLFARRRERVALDLLPRTVRRALVDTGSATMTSLTPFTTARTTDRQRRLLSVADR